MSFINWPGHWYFSIPFLTRFFCVKCQRTLIVNFTAPALGRVPEIPMVESALPPDTLAKQAESGNATPPWT